MADPWDEIVDDEEDTPGEIIHRFGEYSPYEMRVFHKRLNDLKRGYREFWTAKHKEAGKDWPFYMSQSTLVTIVFLYLNDLKEYKVFHDPNIGINNLKRAAYLSRWISNMRPIELDKDHKLKNPDLAFLNEEYATYIFLLYLGVGRKSFRLPVVEAVSSELKFIFKFRDPQRELLVALAKATKMAIAGAS